MRIGNSSVRIFFSVFSANGWSNPKLFQPKTINTPWAIIPLNQLIRVHDFGGEKEETNKQTDRQTQ